MSVCSKCNIDRYIIDIITFTPLSSCIYIPKTNKSSNCAPEVNMCTIKESLKCQKHYLRIWTM